VTAAALYTLQLTLALLVEWWMRRLPASRSRDCSAGAPTLPSGEEGGQVAMS